MDDFEKWRRYRAMAKAMASQIPTSPYELIRDVERASGLAECSHCGLEFHDHPEIEPTVVRTCDGRLWKL